MSDATGAGTTGPGPVDWDQFHDGEEVAVTLVGTWDGDPANYMGPRLRVGDSWLYLQYHLRHAADAYTIEPAIQDGDLVYDRDNWLFQRISQDQYRALLDDTGSIFTSGEVWHLDDLALPLRRATVTPHG